MRTLIHEIIVDVDPDQGALILTIHWKGGIHTELQSCAVGDAVRTARRIQRILWKE